jgi:hypothetical protein
VDEQWERLCDQVKSAGSAALRQRPDLCERELAEGLRFLSQVLADSLSAQLGRPDHDGPFVSRFLDEFMAYGIPNTDNAYLYSYLNGNSTYRLTGNTHGRQFILSSASGEYTYWGMAQIAELDSSEIERNLDGSFEVILGPQPQPGNYFQLDPATTLLMIRDYFEEWDDEPAWFYLECLDDGFAPSVECHEPAAVSRRIARVGEQFAWNSRFWTEYPDRWRGGEPNNFAVTDRPDMVSKTLLDYRVGWVRLQPDEALIIEIDPPPDAYWAIQLYSRWGLPLDPAIAQSTLNSRQVVPDADGRIRIVACTDDPGVANWLDMRGHEAATVWYRLKPADGIDVPTTRLLRRSEILAALPDAKQVSAPERRTALAHRQRSASRRGLR